MEPLGVQRRYVPHLKGLISGKVEPKDQGRDSTITLCHSHLKKAILHLKITIVRIFICRSVSVAQSITSVLTLSHGSLSFTRMNHAGKQLAPTLKFLLTVR